MTAEELLKLPAKMSWLIVQGPDGALPIEQLPDDSYVIKLNRLVGTMRARGMKMRVAEDDISAIVLAGGVDIYRAVDGFAPMMPHRHDRFITTLAGTATQIFPLSLRATLKTSQGQ